MSSENRPALPQSPLGRAKRLFFGDAKDLHDPSIGHKISLIAFFAWVGLGADGLSSSAYGPEEAYRTLGQHIYLAPLLVLATALTVGIISYAYTRIIEHFPLGGGGYIVATELLGKSAGVVSGCALIVDYVLTITVSIASGADAMFSLLPLSMAPWKLPLEYAAILLLMAMNLRGVRESVTMIVPIFLTFIVTHIVLILGGIAVNLSHAGHVAAEMHSGLQSGVASIGKWGLFLVFLKAYSLGGGTYTGIEAVSNGVGILREPKVATGKRTMRYMAISLAFTAGGLLLCYMLAGVTPLEGRTLNAVLAGNLMGSTHIGSLDIGGILVFVTIGSEAALLLIAAQTGFIDGPRVMANMALDSWLPRRFTALSDRLTMQNGILIFGLSAIAILAYSHGSIGILVVMYSVNVFLTFSLSEGGMVRYWIRNRGKERIWKRELAIHATGLTMCICILMVMIFEKFQQGAWITAVITAVCIGLCFVIRRHYRQVAAKIKSSDQNIRGLPKGTVAKAPPFDPAAPTAVILVGGYSSMGIRTFESVLKSFNKSFRNVVFATVGMVNADFFRSGQTVKTLEKQTSDTLQHYAAYAELRGIPARYEYRMGTEVVETAANLCIELSKKYPGSIFFAGEMVFEKPQWYHSILHNETAYAILRRIKFAGLTMMILPVRITQKGVE
jgi:amino acid transporter